MSYETAVARMYALGHELANTPSHKFDLAHMRALLAALNHPERKFPGVLIAGTNGKGSTAATLASILSQLNPARFVRVHRSAAVDLARIRATHRLATGRLVLTLDNGERVPVSRRPARVCKELAAL